MFWSRLCLLWSVFSLDVGEKGCIIDTDGCVLDPMLVVLVVLYLVYLGVGCAVFGIFF